MAVGTTRRRRARATKAPANQTLATNRTVRGRANPNAFTAFVTACNAVIDTMTQYGMAGKEKASHVFTEIGQGLLSPATFSGSRSLGTRSIPLGTIAPGATVRTVTTRARGRRPRVSKVATQPSITPQQQQILNSIGIGQQVSPAQVASMLGISPTTAGRSLGSLQNKKLLQSSGRGQNKVYWKQQAMQQAASG